MSCETSVRVYRALWRADWVCNRNAKPQLITSTEAVTMNSHASNLRETGTSSLLRRRKGLFHSPQRICSTTEVTAMPTPVKVIMGIAQVLTT